MRAILTNGVRPRAGRPHLSLSNSGTSIQRTSILPTQDQLTLCDALTSLLVPIHTTTLFVDVARKDYRRRVWNQEIAQLQQEVDELRAIDRRAWTSFRARPVYAGTGSQRRHYSATIPRELQSIGAFCSVSVESDPTNIASSASSQFVAREQQADVQRFENLLATKVGLQFLLYISTGRDPTAKLNMDRLSSSTVVPSSMNALLTQLARVNQGLYKMKDKIANLSASSGADTPERHQLDSQISTLTWKCRTGDLSIPDLVYGYTQAVMGSQTGPSLNTYQNLVETFSTLDADALTFIAMIPYTRTKQVHSDKHIGNIIQQYGKFKDSRRLERLLQRLVQPDRGFAIATQWETVVVDGVSIPAPVNGRPRILDALVRAALQGDQPHKARAWAALLFRSSVSTRRLAAIFNNFLTYCARQLDWPYGQLWLDRATAWAALFAKDAPWMLQRVIFRMLDLCMSCEQHDQYTQILEAAVLAGVAVPPLDDTRPDAFSNQARKIRADWASRMQEKMVSPQGVQANVDAASIFQTEMVRFNAAIEDFVGVTNLETLKAILDSKQATLVREDARGRFDSVSYRHSARSVDPNDTVSAKETVLTNTTTEDQSDGEQLDLTRQLWILQGSYHRLSESYRQQHEDLIHLQKHAEKEFVTQAQTTEQQEKALAFRQQLEKFEAQNADLRAQLQVSNEREHDLMQANEDLRSQLKSVKPKSLEAVFVEKENLNLRIEMRTLRQRYLAALDEKEDKDKEMAALQARRDRLDERRSADMHLLSQENDNLRLQLEAANKQHQKMVQARAAREGNLQRILLIKEERIDKLRAELSKAKTPDEQFNSTRADEAEASSGRLREGHTFRSSGVRYTLRSRKTNDNESSSSNNVDSFSFSS